MKTNIKFVTKGKTESSRIYAIFLQNGSVVLKFFRV